MKRILAMNFVPLALVYAGFLTLSQRTFSFEAECLTQTVCPDQPFEVKVRSKNVSGSAIRYRGSSTISGATISLYSLSGGEKVELASESYAETCDLTIVTIENGRVLERTWTFLPEHQESGRFPAGVYHLRLEYYDSVEMIENFLEIPAEQPA